MTDTPRRLILMRHAEAERPRVGASDFERGLTETGHAAATRMGRALAAAGLAPGRALVSSARRAKETWEGVSAAFPDTPATFDKHIYEASAASLNALANEQARTGETLIIVGHNPGVQAFASALAGATGARRLGLGFPTASVAAFRFSEDGTSELERFLTLPDGAE
ncbi:MAG: SixA phosphatase family protein [Caulobacteraceae bacterium]